MTNDELPDLEETLNSIFESLANPLRRRILEVLKNEGPLPYTELMRRCGIKDSRTLKHHLERLGPLITKGRGGTYVVTKLGSRVLRYLEVLRDELIDIIAFTRAPKPLIVFRSSVRHYLILAATLSAVTLSVLAASGPAYLVIALAIASLTSLVIAGIRRSRIVVIRSNSIVEYVTTPMNTSKRMIKCVILGAEVTTNALLKMFGLVKVSLITDTGTSLRTYVLGVTTDSGARRYVDSINRLLESSEIKLRFGRE